MDDTAHPLESNVMAQIEDNRQHPERLVRWPGPTPDTGEPEPSPGDSLTWHPLSEGSGIF